MTNLASLLKTEIARVARKELRAETASLKKAVAAHRSDIAALKRRVLALEAEVRRLGKAGAKARARVPADAEAADTGARPRFSVKSLVSQRRRLGLSVNECALLVGASGQSVYNWEEGKIRPRAKHLHAIAALRGMGRKEAAARLAELRAA